MQRVFMNCHPVSGFHDEERDGIGPFVWAQKQFEVAADTNAGYLFFELERPDASVSASLLSNNGWTLPLELARGWDKYALKLPAGVERLSFQIARRFEVPADSRELAVRFRHLEFSQDEARFLALERLAARRQNRILNEKEYQSGCSRLASVPPQLRITLEKRCNVAQKAPCVYCSWEWAKRAEEGSPPFDRSFMAALGKYFEIASEINDCSYGEPTLNPDFEPIVARLTDSCRPFGFTSNGQTLTPKIRASLVGREINFYVSIDSASPESYARYRNDRFQEVVDNLRALCKEKKNHDNKPFVTVSFIVMHSNIPEIRHFMALFHDVGVDRIYFRSLFREDNLDVRRIERCGATFDYDSELVEFEELNALGPSIREAAQAVGQLIELEWEGVISSFTRENGPLCSEPWHTLYLLNRGIMPCCYGRRPVARWAERGNRTTEEFIASVVNGEAFVTIRQELAQNRFPQYCLDSPNCALVKQHLSKKPGDKAAWRS